MRSQAEAYATILVALMALALLEVAAIALRYAYLNQNTLSSEALRIAENLYVNQGHCIKSSISTVAVLVLAYNCTSVKEVAYNASLSPDAWTCVSVEPGFGLAVLTKHGNLFTVDSSLKVYKYQ
ncbi:MAG: hypothetical protein QW479_01315 [Desulfurococcaceae archaeon]